MRAPKHLIFIKKVEKHDINLKNYLQLHCAVDDVLVPNSYLRMLHCFILKASNINQ